MSASLYYFYDPMCSWCWGFEPTKKRLFESLPKGVVVNYVAGGLAPDSDQPMPVEMQQKLQSIWQQIQRRLGTQFNFDFWQDCQPRRSTFPSCRAAIAAGLQGRQADMILAIQKAYYLRAMNPSDLDTLITLAEELGLDRDQFEADLSGKEVEELFEAQLELTSKMPIQGFPSLVLEVEGHLFPLMLDYENHESMLTQIHRCLADASVV